MKKKILVADDSLTIQKVVELTFADTDYRLTCVSNGRLALEKVREEPPDVILADVVMPEKNGYEVCEEIKKNPATASIPVILLAGTFEPFDRDRAAGLGCDAIISKPFDSRELYRKVEALVSARPATSAPAGEIEAQPAPAPTGPAVLHPAQPPRPNPFDAGFVEEDFTGSIRTLRAGRGEPLANLYGPEDVESALAAFRDVEPTARAADWRPAGDPTPTSTARPTEAAIVRHMDEGGDAEESEEPPAARISVSSPEPRILDADDGRTQRIDVSDFRTPGSRSGGTTIEIGRDVVGNPPHLPPLPVDPTPEAATERAPETRAAPSEIGAAVRELSEADLDRLAERVATRLVEKLANRIVREVAWEVVPETAELVVRERLRELESGVE